MSVRSLTTRGFQQLFVIVFIHVGSRRLYVTPSTANPDAAWVRLQAEAFLGQLPAEARGKFYVQHDRDSKFSAAFDDPLKAAGAEILKSPYRSPNMTAFVERVIQTIRVEALDHFVVLGQRHLDYIISVFAAFYNERRPHQSKDNLTLATANTTKAKKSRQKKPAEPALVESLPISEVRCEKQLGGLLKHYYRKAA